MIGDVFFLSELDKSLLSIGQLLEPGYDYMIKEEEKNVMAEVKMGSYRCFSLNFKYLRDINLKAMVIDEPWLSHRR